MLADSRNPVLQAIPERRMVAASHGKGKSAKG
jgi:hypothetical protein